EQRKEHRHTDEPADERPAHGGRASRCERISHRSSWGAERQDVRNPTRFHIGETGHYDHHDRGDTSEIHASHIGSGVCQSEFTPVFQDVYVELIAVLNRLIPTAPTSPIRVVRRAYSM